MRAKKKRKKPEGAIERITKFDADHGGNLFVSGYKEGCAKEGEKVRKRKKPQETLQES